VHPLALPSTTNALLVQAIDMMEALVRGESQRAHRAACQLRQTAWAHGRADIGACAGVMAMHLSDPFADPGEIDAARDALLRTVQDEVLAARTP
jgi:hypothetical protein